MSIVGKNLLGSAAAIAMFVAAPSAAFAFDAVNWEWNKTVTETVDIDIDINAEFDPTGLTQVEKLQIQIGDVEATSSVHDIDNNQPAGAGGGTGTFSETFVFDTFTVEGSGVIDNINAAGPISQNGINGTFDGGTVDETTVPGMGDPTQLTFTVDGTVTVDPAASFDAATELPSIDSAATAVGNNQTINSDVATYLHDAQLLFDVQEDADLDAQDAIGALAAVALGSQFIDNSHTAFAVGATALAITGTIEKAEVDATSEVYNILNARVDSSATAVGNNMSVNVNADGDPTGDSILVADITQFSLADVSATSDVYEVAVNNYTNLAAVNPLVSSAATAVGNNVSINVGNVTP